VEHEFEITRDGTVVARASKAWVRVRDTYGIEVAAGEDVPLMCAFVVAITELAR